MTFFEFFIFGEKQWDPRHFNLQRLQELAEAGLDFKWSSYDQKREVTDTVFFTDGGPVLQKWWILVKQCPIWKIFDLQVI